MSDAIDAQCGDNEACALMKRDALSRKLVQEGKLPKVDWTKIIEHIDHAVKLVGADHVGLGSDFDGANMPFGMEDATHIPQIADALLAHGYSEADIQKILGGNILRVMRQVEAAAKEIARVKFSKA
jgi:membrane dipeptidase